MLCWAKFWLINYTVFETLPGPHWLRSESNPGCEQPNKVFFNINVGYSENQKCLYLRKGKKQKNKQNTYGRHWISLRVLWPGQNRGKRLLLRHQFCYRPPVTLFEWGCCAVARPRPWCSAVTRVKWPTPPIAELQIKPKSKSNQTENLERLYNCLVSLFLSFFLVCHAQNSSDVTLAFEDAD